MLGNDIIKQSDAGNAGGIWRKKVDHGKGENCVYNFNS